MPKRKAVYDDWELYREDILELYIRQDMPLKDVMSTMAERGFKRTQVNATQFKPR
jgi:hypothetical protein